MNDDVKQLQQERTGLYEDIWTNIIPKRLPVSMKVSTQIIAELCGVDVFAMQYDLSKIKAPAEDLCNRLYSDMCPISGAHSALQGQLYDSKTFTMGGNGYIQHPNVSAMYADEYDELIEDPFAFIFETVLPRLFQNLNPDKPMSMLQHYIMANMSSAQDSAMLGSIVKEMNEKKGYYKGAPAGSNTFTAAPYDYIADQLRSFSEISKDIRRNREKLAQACEALYPFCFNMGLPTNISPYGAITTPLHMPTFMREKDFIEIWLPTYKRMCREYAALGARMSIFLEDDWTRYYDILADELPASMYLRFEYADPKTVKEKLGDKYILGLLYPFEVIRYKTKQQAIDKAKELLDVMMPGGGYMFGYDKLPLMASDVNFENLCAVHEFVHEYAVYDNAGESFGQKLNSENFDFDASMIQPIKSKYVVDFDSFCKAYPFTPKSAQKRLISTQNEFFRNIGRMLT